MSLYAFIVGDYVHVYIHTCTGIYPVINKGLHLKHKISLIFWQSKKIYVNIWENQEICVIYMCVQSMYIFTKGGHNVAIHIQYI